MSLRVTKCGGHVGRSHANALKEVKTKKAFDVAYISRHKVEFPTVETVACCCKGSDTQQSVDPSVMAS